MGGPAFSAIGPAMFERPLPRWLAWAADPEQLQRAPFLARSPLFAGLPRRLLGRLATRFFEKVYHPGEVVFEEGDPGRALFVVVEGAVEITRDRAGCLRPEHARARRRLRRARPHRRLP